MSKVNAVFLREWGYGGGCTAGALGPAPTSSSPLPLSLAQCVLLQCGTNCSV